MSKTRHARPTRSSRSMVGIAVAYTPSLVRDRSPKTSYGAPILADPEESVQRGHIVTSSIAS